MEKRKYSFGKDDTLIVKGVAIIMMMYHHCFFCKERLEGHEIIPNPISMSLLINTSNFCKVCVAMFVFLSAYGMTISIKKIRKNMELSKCEFLEYTQKRYFSLMTGWFFVFTFCQIFSWFYARLQHDVYTGKKLYSLISFFIDGLGLGDLFGTPMLVGTWWYMSLANIIIIIFPFIIMLYNKIGANILILVAIILPRVMNISYEPFRKWILAIVLGVVFADKDLLVSMREKKILENVYLNKILKFLLSMIALTVGIYLWKYEEFGSIYEIRHSILGILVVYIVYEFIAPIKYLRSFLCFAGKHSMNIFLIHTFIRKEFFNDFIYSFKYPIVIVAVLFSTSLLVSIVIEFLKKITGYNCFVEKLRKRLF